MNLTKQYNGFAKDYSHKEKVESILFGGLLKVTEPTHTFNEYLSPWFLKNFDISEFEECFDPYAAKKVDGDSFKRENKL